MKEKPNFVEKLSQDVAIKLNKHLKKEGIELVKLKFGLEVIFINIFKIIIIFLVAYYCKLLKEAVIMLAVFGCLRSNAFGLHAKNSIVCTLMSLLMFVLGGYLSRYLMFNNYIVVISFCIIILFLLKYAPGDTEAHPLVGEKLRNRLKKNAVIIGVLLMVVALIVPDKEIKTCIILSGFYETISILPITYKILKRRYKNYYEFEKASE